MLSRCSNAPRLVEHGYAVFGARLTPPWRMADLANMDDAALTIRQTVALIANAVRLKFLESVKAKLAIATSVASN